MDVREKLVELVGQVQDCGCDVTDVVEMNYVENITLADHLIANGVVVQEWISVKDRLPDNRDDVLLCRKWWNEIRNPQMGWYNDVSRAWFDLSNREIRNVTHWMPLPQPPKGE